MPAVCKVHCPVEDSEMAGRVPGQRRWDKYANSPTPEKQGLKEGRYKSSEDKGTQLPRKTGRNNSRRDWHCDQTLKHR